MKKQAHRKPPAKSRRKQARQQAGPAAARAPRGTAGPAPRRPGYATPGHAKRGHATRGYATRIGSAGLALVALGRALTRVAVPAGVAGNWTFAAGRRLGDAGRATIATLPRVAGVASAYSRDDRETLALLLMPFVLLAAVIALSAGVHFERSMRSIIAERSTSVSAERSATPALPPVSPRVLAPTPPAATNPIAAVREPASVAPAAGPGLLAPSAAATAPVAVPPSAVAAAPPAREAAPVGSPRTLVPVAGAARQASPASGPRPAAVPAPRDVIAALPPRAIPPSPGTALPSPAVAAVSLAETATRPLGEIAALDPRLGAGIRAEEVSPGAEPGFGSGRSSSPPAAVAAAAGQADPRCSLAAAVASGGKPARAGAPAAPGLAGAEFGLRLAAAAERQTEQFTFYDDAYRRIAYPMGDVPTLYGVCTDVVIRAYRALGIDLQVAVQKSGVGSGDTNIDHRRTETLRRFFARSGASLPVTSYGEDYAPGDIVTYDRPQNSGSRSHIAIVADRIGPSGAPMIVHNRGWGVQIEDGLFVDRITGHYRYDGRVGAGGEAVARRVAPPARSRLAGPSPTLGKARPVLAPAKTRRDLRAAPERHTSARPVADRAGSLATQ